MMHFVRLIYFWPVHIFGAARVLLVIRRETPVDPHGSLPCMATIITAADIDDVDDSDDSDDYNNDDDEVGCVSALANKVTLPYLHLPNSF